MTTATRYESLPDALRALDDAVHALVGPQQQIFENRLVEIASRYGQLSAAVSGEQTNPGGGTGSKSRPPCWLDALDLLLEINTTIEAWQPQKWRWRPQDCKQIQQIADILTQWTIEIDGLLNPTPTAFLMSPHTHSPAACTNCGAQWIHRLDSSGELVRQPALKITAEGCLCQQCHTQWQPGQLQLLAAAIGYPLPAGVCG